MYQDMQSITKEVHDIHSSLDDGIKMAKILFESASTPVLFLDDQLTILMVNTSWTEYLGWRQENLLGRKIGKFISEDHIQDFYQLQNSLHRDEQYWRGEFLIKDNRGHQIRSELTVQRVELKEKTIYSLYLKMPLNLPESNVRKREGGRENQISEVLNRAIQSLERDQSRYNQDLAHHIEVNLLPTLEKMSREPSSKIRNSYLKVITDELTSLSENSMMENDGELLKLTPTEMEICQYIQAGRSSQEISEMMYSSFETIQTHRKNIRKKMGLKGKKTPLCTYLRVKKRLPKPREDKASLT